MSNWAGSGIDRTKLFEGALRRAQAANEPSPDTSGDAGDPPFNGSKQYGACPVEVSSERDPDSKITLIYRI